LSLSVTAEAAIRLTSHMSSASLRHNSALLTDAYSSLRCACGAAKRGR
jgi:hypothetical protein